MKQPTELTAVAALARIEEVRGQMTSNELAREKAATAARTVWSLGDYHRFAKELVWELGPVLVEACGISPGQRVLDVAAGTGNVAIRAAEAGADVVALDITPESLAAGQREAESRGIELQWVEGNAQALPLGDGEFDVVTSAVGAMFAPDHQAVADEMLRVCRPGGTIGMITFVPERLTADFFELLGRYAPPPAPGAPPPILWGDENHVRELFGDALTSLELTRRQYVEKLSGPAGTPRDYVGFYKETFGPMVAIYAGLTDRPEEAAALDRDLLDLATRWNSGTPEAAEYHYDYLLIVARKR
jgi:2-polyprenyl-3-methyl-5-hydroxy-6-metoxy-1,4-benzoquinol methylase